MRAREIIEATLGFVLGILLGRTAVDIIEYYYHHKRGESLCEHI